MPPASRLHIHPAATPARQASTTDRNRSPSGENVRFRSASSVASSVRLPIHAVIGAIKAENSFDVMDTQGRLSSSSSDHDTRHVKHNKSYHLCLPLKLRYGVIARQGPQDAGKRSILDYCQWYALYF